MPGRILSLYPRGGFVAPGICDSWHIVLGEERIDETYAAFMTDYVPSMSNTLLRNNGLYNAHIYQRKAKWWAEEHPGITYQCENTFAEVLCFLFVCLFVFLFVF